MIAGVTDIASEVGSARDRRAARTFQCRRDITAHLRLDAAMQARRAALDALISRRSKC
jgi:hypothetical protein